MCYFKHISLGKSFEVARPFWGKKKKVKNPTLSCYLGNSILP